MNKNILLPAMLAASLTLSACGGGGDSSPTSQNATGDSGSVATPFVKGSAARYVWNGIGSQSVGNLTTYTQTTSGAVTVINDRTLTGQTAVMDINGDANYALGRWVKGTVNSSSGTAVLDGVSNNAYHYVLVNNLAVLPTNGTYRCDTGKFTAPTYSGGTNVAASAYSGTTTGSATLSFSAAGAVVGVNLNTSAGGQAGSVVANSTISTSSTSVITGNYLSGEAGLQLMVSDGGNGKVMVIVPYQTALVNGAKYQGIAAFSCSM